MTESSLVEDSKSEDKKDPIVDILTSLLHKYEALEKESRVCKNDLKKVIKLYQKKFQKVKENIILIEHPVDLLNHL